MISAKRRRRCNLDDVEKNRAPQYFATKTVKKEHELKKNVLLFILCS